jgi:hypothetical protein
MLARLGRLARDKHSSLLGSLISYEDQMKCFEFNFIGFVSSKIYGKLLKEVTLHVVSLFITKQQATRLTVISKPYLTKMLSVPC